MTEKLERALEASRADIERGLAEAEAELARCHERCRELELLIARAKAALGRQDRSTESLNRPMYLHEAIRLVLKDNGNRWMTVKDLANEVNHRRLYRKRDGSNVEANQIHARTKNYEAMFEKDGPRVRLKVGD